MPRSVFIALGCLVIAACSEAPTNDPSQQRAAGASFARGGASDQGAQFLQVDETGVDVALPGGFCSFRPDGAGEFNNFLRTNPNGTRFLKIQDASGVMTVDPFGDRPWVGTGRVNLSWPDYPDGQSFELIMVGDHDPDGNAASCKYKIANGIAVEWFIKTK